MRFGPGVLHLLVALLVAAFICLYPQLDGAGLCEGDGCPKITYGAQGAGGTASGGLSGISLVVAALVSVAGAALMRAAGVALPLAPPDALVGIDVPPDVPPPRPSL